MTAPDGEVPVSRVQQYWWLHDARWYQEVAKRFGFDAANEINKAAVAVVAFRVAQAVARSLETPVEKLGWDEVVEVIQRCPKQMWGPDFVAYVYEKTAPGELTTHLTRNFAINMSRQAGTLDTYQCPCLELRSAWYRGLGLTVERDEILGCLKDGAEACTYRVKFSGFEPDGG